MPLKRLRDEEGSRVEGSSNRVEGNNNTADGSNSNSSKDDGTKRFKRGSNAIHTLCSQFRLDEALRQSSEVMMEKFSAHDCCCEEMRALVCFRVASKYWCDFADFWLQEDTQLCARAGCGHTRPTRQQWYDLECRALSACGWRVPVPLDAIT
jgi:hypothetical protein